MRPRNFSESANFPFRRAALSVREKRSANHLSVNLGSDGFVLHDLRARRPAAPNLLAMPGIGERVARSIAACSSSLAIEGRDTPHSAPQYSEALRV
jgi:hypothetical protein